MANNNPKIDKLIDNSKQKSKITKQKAEEALKKMIKKQMKINFNSVSEEAHVSKSFLYKDKDLRARIETLRSQQEGLPSPRQVKRNMSNESKDVIIATLRKKIEKLEDENKKLKNQLQKDLNDFYKEL
ncbi:transposase [Robertmurraya yapensis]|uniref:Transposase n=1 Tax=Bacillus yapensis TaxID=2492960 RepID=A0A431W6L4_9BACI|nr:DUF6262 family protein [Bacillus yapensis]RTR31132.1 transposase [Bacillus yapensis]TKS95561.1 transposase [Bacillus yapensis]